MREFSFLTLQTEFFLLASYFCAVRGIRAGSSRKESDYSRRVIYPDQFFASWESQSREIRSIKSGLGLDLALPGRADRLLMCVIERMLPGGSRIVCLFCD